MKSLPSPQHNYSALHEMAMAPLRARLLMVGLELKIFDLLTEAASPEVVAEAIGGHPGNTRMFLDALTTIGLLEKAHGHYRNGPDTATFLVTNEPAYLGSFLNLIEEMCITPLGHLMGMIKEGPSTKAESEEFTSEALWADVTRTSAAWVTGGPGAQLAGQIAKLPEFPNFKRMLDLGGGHGMFALYFANIHPAMTAVVFDRPSVVKVAAHFAEEYGLQERVSVQAGDYLKDDLGSGYDFVWACATLNFARYELDALFTKIAESLNPGGVFISFQDGLTHERTQPDIMLGHLGHSLQMGVDLSFEQGEISKTMLRCGFRSVQSRSIATPMGMMEMDIGRT